MTARTHQTIAALTLALTLSAVLVGGAQADRRGIGAKSTDVSDVFTRAVARTYSAQAVRPDDRAGLRGVGITPLATPVDLTDVFERAVLRHNASGLPRPDDRAGLRGVGTPLAASEPAATIVSAGFQWADAAIGAAAALALVLILAGSAAALGSHHRGRAILD
jgi:hypothetical protein